MRHSFHTAAIGAVCLGLVACTDTVTPATDPAPSFVVQGAEVIPISFVTQFVSFDGGDLDPKGESGRTQSSFCLTFSVQEGDFAGTLHSCGSANDPSDQTASRGPDGWYSVAIPGEDEYDVCMPARGWCGTFSGVTSTGKVYPLPRGVEFNNSVAFGSGDFAGMKLQGTVFECADSQGDRGCFEGELLVPAGD